jgi:hypothetical protein
VKYREGAKKEGKERRRTAKEGKKSEERRKGKGIEKRRMLLKI